MAGSWQHYTVGTPFPTEIAVRCGTDADGTAIYVGRAFHSGEVIPAKVMPGKDVAFIPYGGEEVEVQEIEILRKGAFVWEFASGGEIPDGAVQAGTAADGEKLYFGRCLYEGSQTPGKIQSSHNCLYIPFNGEEVCIAEYEVLVVK